MMMVVVLLEILRVGAAAMVAFDPGFAAVVVNFLLPDGEAVFDIVDDIAAGEKCVATVVGGYADPYGDVANCQLADAMDDGRLYFELFFGLSQNLLRDARCELGIATIVQFSHGLALVMIAHPTFVAAIRTRAQGEQLLAQCGRIDGLVCELKCHLV